MERTSLDPRTRCQTGRKTYQITSPPLGRDYSGWSRLSSGSRVLGPFHLAVLCCSTYLPWNATRRARARRNGYLVQFWWRWWSPKGSLRVGLQHLDNRCSSHLWADACVGQGPKMDSILGILSTESAVWLCLLLLATLQKVVPTVYP